MFEVRKKDSNIKICSKAKLASGIYERMKGLMFSKSLEGFDGLILDPCNSIHTCFMNYNIDVIFLDKDLTIIKIIRDMKKWRMSNIYFSSKKVIEIDGCSLDQSISEGDKLEIVCIN
ncbi:MAG: DUF192 domain-containing protein [Bdellovibrionales bacterium]|jgi:uncharacterized protein|nr:DUF192 domain-containing protein [Bdellovibrionales bacterium]